MIDPKIQVAGYEELKKAIAALPERMRQRVIGGVARKGALVMQNAWVEVIPRGPGRHKQGHGHENIKVTPLVRTPGEAAYAVHTWKAFWLFWYEFGRGIIRAGFRRGKVLPEKTRKGTKRKIASVLSDGNTIYGTSVQAQPARPVMRNAFEHTAQASVDAMLKEAVAGLLREAKILAGETAKAIKKGFGV